MGIYIIDFLYYFLIFSILLYMDLELLSRTNVIKKEKTAVIQAIVGSAIILEVFYGISNFQTVFSSVFFDRSAKNLIFDGINIIMNLTEVYCGF